MTNTHKMLNGKRVVLTSGEVAALDARDTAWTASAAVRQARIDRSASLAADVELSELRNRLTNATASQIDQWFAGNVTTPTQTIAALKAVCKILAAQLASQRS